MSRGNQHSKFWTPERISELRQLWATSLNSVQIAKRMGCSTDSVRGKAFRLRLPTKKVYWQPHLAAHHPRANA